MKLDLVIFDMDGLMFDTERINYEAWLGVAKTHQFPFDETTHTSMIGMRKKDIPSFLQEIYGTEADILGWQEKVGLSQKEYIQTKQTVHKKKGLMELLDFLKEKNVKLVVASSSSIETIEHHLQLEGIRHYFDALVSGEEVKHGKPAPDIFLRACELAECHPENAIVLEDSKYGLMGAKAAGIKSIFVPDRVPETVGLSDYIVKDLAEVILLVEQWL